MKNCVPSCTCLQHADDSTIHRHCKAKDIKSCANFLTSELPSMLTWSSSNNLVFNAAKTKATLFTTRQMEKLHGFEQDEVELKCKDKTQENVNKFKLLGITIDKNLHWKKHINNTTKNCYATRNVLRKIRGGEGVYLTKRFQPVHQQEELVRAMLLRSIRTNGSS